MEHVKYTLTPENGIYRIKSLNTIETSYITVRPSMRGGYVESEKNLSHDGTCWIYDDAVVCGDAVVRDDAIVKDNVSIFGSAEIYDNAYLCRNVEVKGGSKVFEYAQLLDHVKVCDSAQIKGYARVEDFVKIYSNAIINGNVLIKGYAKIGKNAYITSNDDYFCIDNIGSREATVTFYVDKDRNIYVATGCFNDTLGAFEEVVKETYGNDKYAEQYYLAIQLAKARLR